MRILWIVNTIFPYPASKIEVKPTCFGGWLNGLADDLKKEQNIDLAIATVYCGKKVEKFYDGKITYYLIPGAPAIKYNDKINTYCKEVINDFNPQIIHIHGTEYAHGLSFLNCCDDKVKKIVSIQGLTSCIEKVYLANIPSKKILKNITFRDLIKFDNIFQQQKKLKKRGEVEKQIIKQTDAIIGRTDWDYANVKAIKTDVKYFKGNETLRSCFYNDSWDINKTEKYSIFTSQASYPIKGLHYLLETINILKLKYPNVKLYIGGQNITDISNVKKRIKLTGYGKYIRNLIKKYNLKDNVFFLGMLDEEKMKERLLKTHVFVLPSAIENSSNSLGEAMLLGMPCVATNTGGTMDILEHKKEGFLYSYTEPAICAEYISIFFEDSELCIKYGQEAKKTARDRHNPKNNIEKLLKIYKKEIYN